MSATEWDKPSASAGQPLQSLRTLIFDYGGTLDTDGRHWSHVLKEGYQAAGIHLDNEVWRDAYVYGERALAKSPVICPEDDFHTLLYKKVLLETDRLAELDLFFAGGREKTRIARAVADWCDSYVRRNMETTRRVLDALRPYYSFVLVSNFYGNISAVLAGYGLTEYFPKIVESAVVGVRKPDPAIYRLGVEAAGCRPAETLVIGDSLRKDIVPALAVGCHAFWLKGEAWEEEAPPAFGEYTEFHHFADLPWLIREKGGKG